MKLSSESRFFLITIALTLLLIIGGFFLLNRPPSTPSPTASTPALAKEELISENTPTKGNPDASVYLVEFSDFQCPACKAFQPTVDSLLQKYPDKLLLAYRHFPLDQHPQGQPSAQAAISAQRQGKFWEMHQLLFENQSSLSPDLYPLLAQQLNLDLEAFKTDFESAKDAVNADRQLALSLNVAATPTFFLNGRRLTLFNQQDLITAVESAVNSVD